ncbi:MAG: sigma-54-dependent Fis family transcriptional regulator, partial [Deltaproteobacteria bacterium]|nr:sigma-54-dependent Fis family transcriptional regulator [Deltaproteobacteria bacterium]
GGRSGRTGLRLSPLTEMALLAHAWPGNVRELENVMQRAVIFAAGELVEPDALHLSVLPSSIGKPLAHIPFDSVVVAQVAPEGQKTDNLRDLEREHMLETLVAVGGSRKLAGERLGMSERTLRHKLKQYREAGQFSE